MKLKGKRAYLQPPGVKKAPESKRENAGAGIPGPVLCFLPFTPKNQSGRKMGSGTPQTQPLSGWSLAYQLSVSALSMSTCICQVQASRPREHCIGFGEPGAASRGALPHPRCFSRARHSLDLAQPLSESAVMLEGGIEYRRSSVQELGECGSTENAGPAATLSRINCGTTS